MKFVQSIAPFFACIGAQRFASKPSCCKFRELTVHIFSTHHVLCPWSCMRAIFCCPLSAMVLLFKNRELGAPASRTVHKSEREGEVPYTTAVPAVVQHDVRVHYGSWRTKKMSADSNTSFTDCIVVLTKGREARSLCLCSFRLYVPTYPIWVSRDRYARFGKSQAPLTSLTRITRI